MSYSADVWTLYGVNAIDIWDLPAHVFFIMTYQIDAQRKEAKKNR